MARLTQSLGILERVFTAIGQVHDVIPNGRHHEFALRDTETTQGFPLEQLLAKTLKSGPANAVYVRSALVPVVRRATMLGTAS